MAKRIRRGTNPIPNGKYTVFLNSLAEQGAWDDWHSKNLGHVRAWRTQNYNDQTGEPGFVYFTIDSPPTTPYPYAQLSAPTFAESDEPSSPAPTPEERRAQGPTDDSSPAGGWGILAVLALWWWSQRRRA